MKVLVLAGTAEARALAVALDAAGHAVTVSLAGLTDAPKPQAGRLRTGGFGGAEGLAAWLSAEGTEALVDATHPHAARMPGQAARAAAAAGVPRLRLLRPGWPPEPGWEAVPDLAAAARACAPGARVFLATGRQSFPAFLGRPDLWVLARAAGPGPFPFPLGRLVAGLPPFDAAEERALMAEARIDTLVTRDAGGAREKLDAARALGLRVLVVDRPPPPPGPIAADVAGAIAWVQALAAAK